MPLKRNGKISQLSAKVELNLLGWVELSQRGILALVLMVPCVTFTLNFLNPQIALKIYLLSA